MNQCIEALKQRENQKNKTETESTHFYAFLSGITK